MNILKALVKKYLKHFSYFYIHLRYRIFVSLGLSLTVGILDGFGLAMFLPLMQIADGSQGVDPDSMGNLRFLVDGMQIMGIRFTLVSVMLVMLFFFVLKGMARFLDSWYRVIVQRYFIKKLRFSNADKLSNYSYKAFVMADVGRIQNTLSGEIGQVANAYRNYFLTVQSVIMVLVYIVLAFLANPQFALLVAIGAILSNQVYRVIFKRTKEASKKRTSDSHNFQGQLIQQVAFFKYLKATALMTTYSKKLKETILKVETANKKMGLYGAVLTSTREPLIVMIVIAVVLLQVTYFSQSLSLIILSLLFFYRSLSFLLILQTNWNQFLQASGSLENMTEFTQELQAAQDKTGKQKLDRLENSLELRNAYFSYGAIDVLHDITFRVAKNKTIAFVGESGSGKTTLVNVLAGLLPLDKGEFLIDGVNSNIYNIKSYQRRIGYITQEPVIFSDSVYNNVTFWAENTEENRTRFWDALRKASLDQFVESLPGGENSLLGNNGILISGGQKQRISIARELYKDADVLIMDEATSSLDSETELAIQQNIDALKGQYTILIVAHRLATIKNVDQVVLLNKGKIESAGSFDELKSSSRLFEKMVGLQEV